MRILVFEYIVGGGLAGQALPPSLAAEGGMMLQALLDDLESVPGIRLRVPLDHRCRNVSPPGNAEIIPVDEHRDVFALLPALIAGCDAVWPVAPETDGILACIADMVAAQHKALLLSQPDAVRLCGDKLATYRALSAHDIPAVETLIAADPEAAHFGRCVIKPADGVGCLGGIIVENGQAFQQTINELENPERYVVQPFCEGQAISLSCLFKYGKAWLICCNRQRIEIVNRRFALKGCLVNAANPLRGDYQSLVERVAEAMPGLWGYIGLDVIETPDQGPLILEINPRLTTSYVGIARATGINVAERVLHLLRGDAELQSSNDQAVNVTII